MLTEAIPRQIAFVTLELENRSAFDDISNDIYLVANFNNIFYPAVWTTTTGLQDRRRVMCRNTWRPTHFGITSCMATLSPNKLSIASCFPPSGGCSSSKQKKNPTLAPRRCRKERKDESCSLKDKLSSRRKIQTKERPRL